MKLLLKMKLTSMKPMMLKKLSSTTMQLVEILIVMVMKTTNLMSPKELVNYLYYLFIFNRCWNWWWLSWWQNGWYGIKNSWFWFQTRFLRSLIHDPRLTWRSLNSFRWIYLKNDHWWNWSLFCFRWLENPYRKRRIRLNQWKSRLCWQYCCPCNLTRLRIICPRWSS